MKRKGLILVLITALICLFLGSKNKIEQVDASNYYVYEKVTSTDQVEDNGMYLFVFETDSICFNGGLSTLDAVGNTKSITISENNQILLEKNDCYFIISNNKKNIQSASGYYIGNNNNKNALNNSKTTIYTNTISFDADGNVLVKGNNATTTSTLQYYKATSGSRFRYYTTNQKKIQLYKLVQEPVIEEEKLTSVSFDEVKKIFTTYYNDGIYSKDTLLNVDKDIITEDLTTYFHASKSISLAKTTYYNGDYLYFDNGKGYGTDGDNLTEITVVNGEPEVTHIHSNLPKMESYYCTLHDFIEGKHTSSHVFDKDDNTLILTEGWQKDSKGIYYNETQDVLEAFRLFVAPTWLGKTNENSNYVDYTRATLQVVNETLVMKLWISQQNYGLLSAGYEKDGEHIVFSSAILSKDTYVETSEVSIVFSKLGYSNQQEFTSTSSGVVTITGSLGSNTNKNMPKYYTSGTAVRIYVGNKLTISVANGYAIQKVVIKTNTTYTLSDSTSYTEGVTVTNLTTTEAIFDVNGLSSLEIVSGGTARVASIEVYYYVK